MAFLSLHLHLHGGTVFLLDHLLAVGVAMNDSHGTSAPRSLLPVLELLPDLFLVRLHPLLISPQCKCEGVVLLLLLSLTVRSLQFLSCLLW